MPHYIVRVELRGAEPDDYLVLHSLMEEKGFKTTITSNKSKRTFELPRGQYYIQKGTEPHKILKLVKQATDQVVFESGIVVVEAKGGIFSGLTEIKK